MEKHIIYQNINNFSLKLGNLQVNFLKNGYVCNINNTWSSYAHFHSFYEILFILNGSCNIKNESTVLSLKKNDICIIPPDTNHFSYNVSDDICYANLCISFSKCSSESSTCKSSEFEFFYPLFSSLTKPVILKSGTIDYIKDLDHVDENDSFYSKNKLQGILTLIFNELSNELAKLKDNSPKSNLVFDGVLTEQELLFKYKMEQFIQLNFRETVSISDISQFLHLSERQTHRLIQRTMGYNFKTLLLRQRMIYAEMLIRFSDKSLNDIAIMAGYQSYKGFFDAFRKYFNVSPADMRSNYE